MSSPGAAIGRRQGKADTDNNGLSRYMLKIETPSGIKSGNEPDLSLEYSQGTPNGIMGYSWALSGISSIRLGAPKVVYDKLNPPPPDYDLNQPKLSFDGTDLLNIEGKYLDPSTKYTTEINNTELLITCTANNKGFIATDNMGRQTEYGTTLDSRVQCDNTTVEWRIKSQVDRHGNTITYEYIPSPQGSGTKDVNASYIQKISYCSNSITTVPATRFVKFGYAPRPDLIKQTSHGSTIAWANRLASISVGTNIGTESIDRTYSLTYDQSKTTGDSCLTRVTESASVGGQSVDLLPSSFNYTQPDVAPQDLFQAKASTDAFGAVKCSIGIVPLNMTGRALADLAFMDWDASSMGLTVRTYYAERQTDQTVAWTPSTSNVSLKLPKLDLSMDGELPSFMTPDLRGDGRSDLIIPYQNDGGKLEIFLSESSGEGLTAAKQVKTTDFAWVPKSKFMAMDMAGTGAIDMIQVFQNVDTGTGKLSFRNFPGIVDQEGNIGLGTAFTTNTEYDFDNTIDWFLLRHPGTGGVSLVRVWQDFSQDPNKYQINTTSFSCAKVFDSSTGFNPKGVTCTISGLYAKNDGEPAWSVMSCDINGDGAQDIVLGRAKYENSNMNFTFIVAIADGKGGFFKGDEQKPAAVAAAQPDPDGPAAFSVSNLHGGLYPSLAYVYQRNDTKNIVCLSVGGRAAGTVSTVDTFPVADNPGFAKPQVMPLDLNGTGMGGWLLFNSGQDPQQVISVYNKSKPTDLLLSAEDPMGLTTTVSYGCLSDTNVYDPGVDWRQYKNTGAPEYILLGAPNHVVTELQHANNPTINDLAFGVVIKKKYLQARINNVGRGWLGFESILTTNETAGILTSEHFFQEFPMTGLKCKIDTFPVVQTQMDHPLCSKTIVYKPVPKQTAQWNVYHVDKVFDQVMTSDQTVTVSGAGGRVQRTEFTVDEYSNITAKHYLETQNGTPVFQSWERCTYVAIKGITGLLATKKITAIETNQDATKFEAGDVSFTQYTYDDNTGNMLSESDWFDAGGKFLVTSYTFDGYGNETTSVDPAGLKTETTYDPMFHNLVIQRAESSKGVHITEFMAYDPASSQRVAHLESNGRLTCVKVDGFGRKVKTRLQSVSAGPKSVPAQTFLGSAKYVTLPSFKKLLSSNKTLLDPYEQYGYSRLQSNGGKQYLISTTLSLYNEGPTSQTEILEVMDCVGQRKMQRSRQGMDPSQSPPSENNSHVVWNYWTYDSRGNTTFASFPISSSVAAWNNFEYQPDTSTQGTTSSFDVLGRIISASRPSHDNPSVSVSSTLSYTNGGGIVTEVVDGPSPNVSEKAVELWKAPRSYVSIDGEEHVIASTNQDGMVSSFQYDVAGNVVTATDPNGNVEKRTYNSLGQLQSMDNVYQRMDGVQSGQQPAVTYEYDGAGQLFKTVQVNGDVITFQRDAKGRPLQKSGSDGKLLKYEYDKGGHENLSAMSVYPQGPDKPLESRLDFDYDILGRLAKRTLTLRDRTTYETAFAYDWQDQPMTKTYPNGAEKHNEYLGNILSYTKISNESAAGQPEVWLDGRYEYSDATRKPTAIMVGQASTSRTFVHNLEYDAQAYPLSHQLSALEPSTGQPVPLMKEAYKYTGTDQIAQKTQVLTSTTTRYNYDGKRLSTSQIGDGPVKKYAYDKAGNLTTKDDTSIVYTNNTAKGTDGNGVAFEITYDKSGRMVARDTKKNSMVFTYDSFGLMKSYSDSLNKTTSITAGPDGKTILREQPSVHKSLLIISDDYHVQTQPDGTSITTLKLFGAGILLGSYSKAEPKASSPAQPASGTGTSRDTNAVVFFTDQKGSVTHTYAGNDGQLLETITYDDFGSPSVQTTKTPTNPSARTSTYEATSWDTTSDLLDFSSRWYDPLVGRFTSPDTILDTKALAHTDGLNRFAFENNDPINNNDPSGHWSLSAIFGAVLGAVAVVGAIALTIATGGATAPLAAAAVGALASGGIAGIKYSFDHKNERGGKFWAGYGATVLVNAAIGAASGALGAVASPTRLVSATARYGSGASWGLSHSSINFVGKAAAVGSKALIGATSSLLNTVTHNAVENSVYGANHGLLDGAGIPALTGAVLGGGGAYSSARSVTYAFGTTWTKAAGWKGGALSLVAKTGWTVVKGTGLDEKAKQRGSDYLHEQQKNFRALEKMVGHSGFVGTLSNELHRNALYVNYG